MAQEIYKYFGNDGLGTIGCDTLLASADMDGIMMICLQALEKRTEELKSRNLELKAYNEELKNENKEIKERLTKLEALVGLISENNLKVVKD